MADEILNTHQAAKALGMAAATLEKLRVYGGGPPYCKLGRSVRYRTQDLEGWLAAKVIANTSERA